MNQLRRLAGIAILGLLLASCSAQKRVWYLQDVQPATPEQIAQNGQIRIKPLDRLTIVVNSKDPELAVPFNSSTSLNSLSGMPTANSTTQALQVRTVDENGFTAEYDPSRDITVLTLTTVRGENHIFDLIKAD